MRRAFKRAEERDGEQGFVLLALVVAIFLVMLALGVAAPRVAKELQRDKEVESMHRGQQYVRAVQLYYRKFGHYPGTMDQLVQTNNIRFLRQQYVDPLTGKADWRIIHLGEAKSTIKGFFGQALPGMAPGLGSAAGLASSGGIGAGAAGAGAAGTGAAGGAGAGSSASSGFGSSSSSGFGSSSSSGFGSSSSSGFGSSSSSGFGGSSSGVGSSGPGFGSSSSSGFGSSSSSGFGSSGSGAAGAAGASAAGTGAAGSGTSSSSSSSGTSSAFGGGGAFVGVGSAATGNAILDLNDMTTYQSWEFIYDPRIEQLRNSTTAAGGAGGLGSAAGNASPGLGGASSPAGSSSPGFGSSSGFGSSGTSSPTSPVTKP